MCWYRKHAPQCEVLQIRERTNGCISVLLKQLPSMNSVICSSTTHLDQIDQFPFWALRHGLILINHLAGVSRDSSVDLCPSAMCLLKHIDYWWTFLRVFFLFLFFKKLINLQSIAAKRWLKLSRGNLKKKTKKKTSCRFLYPPFQIVKKTNKKEKLLIAAITYAMAGNNSFCGRSTTLNTILIWCVDVFLNK